MLFRLLAPLIAVLALGISSASGLTITRDPGGRIGDYIDKYKSMLYSNERIVIDGTCASACTLVLGLFPRERMCATARAQLGFHQAFNFGQASTDPKRVVMIASHEATKQMMDLYPVPIQRWIRAHHGLPSPQHMLWLKGKALARLVPTCGIGIGTLAPTDFNWRGLY